MAWNPAGSMSSSSPRHHRQTSLTQPRAIRSESVILPLGAVIGIAVGGAIILALSLGFLACVCARRKHGQKEQIPGVNENGHEDGLDVKDALKTIRPLNSVYGRRSSVNAFVALEDETRQPRWVTHDPFLNPPATKPRRHSSHKGFFRTSGMGMRDSWPLVTNIPLALMSSSHTITPSEVAPPGYILQNSKAPRRAGSLWVNKKRSLSQGSEPDPSSPTKSVRSATSAKSAPLLSRSPKLEFQFPPPAARRPQSMTQRPKSRRRSTSETHLSTILRSTSQRLKAAHRNSLTPTLSTIGRYPGRPPSQNLPDPPIWAAAESREVLIDKEYSEYIRNSLHSSFRNQSPSPGAENQRDSRQGQKPTLPPTPDVESPDSLCNFDTPDLVIPGSLTSPSKHGSPRVEKRHRMRISSGEAKQLSTMLHKDNRASLKAIGSQEPDIKGFSLPHRISLSSDPFYSSVRSSKPIIPSAIPHPRAMSVRKATFGAEATTGRPASFHSPLREVSHNVRTPPKDKEAPKQDHNSVATENQEVNPFQWSLQESMQTRATKTTPKHSAKRKGHKRSNAARLSGLSRPQSTVEAALEEPEEVTPKLKTTSLKFVLPEQPIHRVIEPEKSPSRRSSHRSSIIKPPSSAVFNPILTIPRLRPHSTSSSPFFIAQEQSQPRTVLSPTLSAFNYYESSAGSEDEFFAASKDKGRRDKRTYSTELQKFPAYELQRELQERLLAAQEELFSFQPPTITTSPPARPLPSISSTLTSLRSSTATPILTVPIPSHLTGPRAEPSKASRSPRASAASVHSSITMLRRMNSDISTYSNASSAVTSPNPTSSFSSVNDSGDSKRIRGSKNYLSLGHSSQLRSSSRNPRDSHRVTKDRGRKRLHGDFERLDDGSKDEDDNIPVIAGKHMLTPVREVSCPASTLPRSSPMGLGLRFPTLNREGSTNPTPKSSPPRACPTLKPPTPKAEDEEKDPSPEMVIPPKNPNRFSAMTPTPASHATRRESQMEHPSPVTPISGIGVAGLRLMGKRKGSEIDIESDSPGFYDSDGFLRGSPDRERVLEMREEAKRSVERERREREMLRGSAGVV